MVDLTQPEESRKVLFDLSINDAYNDPGTPVTVTRPDGVRTILQDGDSIYLDRRGGLTRGLAPVPRQDGPEDRPEDRGCSSAPWRPTRRSLGFVGDSRSTILIRHETKVRAAQLFHASTLESGKRTKLTDYRDPAPQLTGLKKELINYRAPTACRSPARSTCRRTTRRARGCH